MKRIDRLMQTVKRGTQSRTRVVLSMIDLHKDGTASGFVDLWDDVPGSDYERIQINATSQEDAESQIDAIIEEHPSPPGKDPVIIFDDIY